MRRGPSTKRIEDSAAARFMMEAEAFLEEEHPWTFYYILFYFSFSLLSPGISTCEYEAA